ncbi:hypothetical protein PO883_31745 [Massilia sp. DJPM01]|uniref:hypothetical protein n=1 Tax=Massilia sp. DJPM01 TaxID=3024404 RepID=UPI00259EE9C6|nr:hypothetical protein [Massilia sp. DJPM01]MDM5181756.1 hypothetical protein [Massilia sp. DJPM01]
MSLITGTNEGFGYRYDALGRQKATGNIVDGVELGALDAPVLIASGSHIADPCHSFGAASSATVRGTCRQSSEFVGSARLGWRDFAKIESELTVGA